ncbi:hypothetical protein OSB04_016604, partial [Centaurea solstitialis]
MASSASSNRKTTGLARVSSNLYCYCGDKVKVRTSWTKTNPGRRFVGCPNYNCKMFQFVDEELPSPYYKELLFDLHTQCSAFGKEKKLKHDEVTESEIVKMMEDLSYTKAKIKLYD